MQVFLLKISVNFDIFLLYHLQQIAHSLIFNKLHNKHSAARHAGLAHFRGEDPANSSVLFTTGVQARTAARGGPLRSSAREVPPAKFRPRRLVDNDQPETTSPQAAVGGSQSVTVRRKGQKSPFSSG